MMPLTIRAGHRPAACHATVEKGINPAHLRIAQQPQLEHQQHLLMLPLN